MSDQPSSTTTSPSKGGYNCGGFFTSVWFLCSIAVVLFAVIGFYFYSHGKSAHPPVLGGDDTIETERVLEDETTPLTSEAGGGGGGNPDARTPDT
ncbi:hypothetical protein Cantr_03874 [Candida viswanathii]|uniref:Uncharacterized protein n=1 Tax=Candida viswanathii TaxID=5486 RepID=A0A367XP29_9ASCO|nr:hypothetical protein Cantr_03874 [Candida viswanathii]